MLRYVRSVFDSEEVLDSIPSSAAANLGAWHAWHAHRTKGRSRIRPPPTVDLEAEVGDTTLESLQSEPNQNAFEEQFHRQWNWAGVWEDRVRRNIENAMADAVLYGRAHGRNDVVCLLSRSGKVEREIQKLMIK